MLFRLLENYFWLILSSYWQPTLFLSGKKLCLHSSVYENSLLGPPSCVDKCGMAAARVLTCCNAVTAIVGPAARDTWP